MSFTHDANLPLPINRFKGAAYEHDEVDENVSPAVRSFSKKSVFTAHAANCTVEPTVMHPARELQAKGIAVAVIMMKTSVDVGCVLIEQRHPVTSQAIARQTKKTAILSTWEKKRRQNNSL
jgi:hypothetical protein